MLSDNCTWKEDIEEILSSLPMLSELENRSILITGAAGLIGSAVTEVLLRYNDTHGNKIQILAAGRNQEKMRARFGAYLDRPYFTFLPYDAAGRELDIPQPADYILHGAGNAYPAAIVREPVETMLANIRGVGNLLDYARRQGTKRLLYISSSEVYGLKQTNAPYREDEYGYIDVLNPRNSYSIGKRAAETLCVSYGAEYGVETVIARPGHIYGPTASPSDNRVSSAWAYAAAKGEPIVMKSDGAQLRSYCCCLDCASALLTILLKGENCQAYNISNPASVISIRELGELLAKAAGVELIREAATKADRKGFNPMSNSSLDSTRLLSLGWRGLFGAERGIAHTVEILREELKKA